MSDKNQDLEQARVDFQNWRSSHSGRRQIPIELRQQAIALTKRHKKSHVFKALGINGVTLKQWMESVSQPVTPSPSKFIEINSIKSTSTQIHLIELTGRNGEKMKIEGLFCISEISELAKSFIGGQP